MHRVAKGHLFIGRMATHVLGGAVAILAARRVMVQVPTDRQRDFLPSRPPWRRMNA
jgi:hypothetical protein